MTPLTMTNENNIHPPTLSFEKDDTKTDYNITWYKLAVAVAIIRSTPARLTAKKYTEELRVAHLLSQNRLQDQYTMAPKQIEELKQIIEKMQFGRTKDINDTPERQGSILIIPDHHSSFAMPSLLTALSYPREASLVENIHFIQSVMSLQNLKNLFTAGETEGLVDAAIKSITAISDAIQRNVLTVSESCLCQAAHNLNLLMETFQWLQDRPAFMKEVCILVERIVHQLFHSSVMGATTKYRRKHLLVKMLLQLTKGKSLPLLLAILDSLVDCAESFCQLLYRCQTTQQLVDPELYSNGYFLVSSLELIMKHWLDKCPLNPEALQEVQHRLDQAILLVKNSFPLVAQAFFRVSSLCELILQNR